MELKGHTRGKRGKCSNPPVEIRERKEETHLQDGDHGEEATC